MLRALSGPLAGATFEVGARVLIGRVPACDILLVDVEVSREHAMIISDGDQPTLVDLGSSNGTFVGGKKVRRVPLNPGDTFSISNSQFIFDRAAPISTTPVLSTQFGIRAQASEDGDSKPTRETPSVDQQGGVTSPTRDTRRSLSAIDDDAEPRSSPPKAEPAPASSGGARPTVRLEAATEGAAGTEPGASDKATVELRAAAESDAPSPPSAEETLHTRVTASLAAVTKSEPQPELSFSPPPFPEDAYGNGDRSKSGVPAPQAEATPSETPPDGAYVGDLLADLTAYRSFRLRLQRGEIPSGEEVASMIDMEAALREPPPEADPRRDVVTQRFFRRFPFEAPVCARFTVTGTTIEVKGTVSNLSVDGLRSSLELGDLTPSKDQLAMLVIDRPREGRMGRYSITARVVYNHEDNVGFVFAGVPSWTERGAFENMDTAVKLRPKLP